MDLINGVDVASLTFAGLFVIGAVNVVTFFKKDLSSNEKFGVAVIAALVAGFVPADLGMDIANRIKDAVVVAVVSSGGYKLLSKAGGEK